MTVLQDDAQLRRGGRAAAGREGAHLVRVGVRVRDRVRARARDRVRVRVRA